MRKSEIMKKEIFILGDSISIHYTPYLRKYLGTGWEIVRKGDIPAPEIPGEIDRENGSDSGTVLLYLQAVIQNITQETILLNAGLHDIKRFPTPVDVCMISLEQYCSNLQQSLDIIRSAGKNTIWVTVTPIDEENHAIHEKAFFRLERDVERYNRASMDLIRRNQIPWIDLGAFTRRIGLPLYCDHAHFNEDVRAIQAAYIAGALEHLANPAMK